jgi:hypothetical protein
MWKNMLRRAAVGRAESERVKGLVFEALGRNPDIGISVNEIVCTDPGCPGTEVVILVMVPLRKTAACKVQKALADVTDDDVRDALRKLAYQA